MFAKYLQRVFAIPQGDNQFTVNGDGYSSTLFSLNADGTVEYLNDGPPLPEPTEAEKAELIEKHDKLITIKAPRWTRADFYPTVEGKEYKGGYEGTHYHYKNKNGETGLIVQRIDPTPENGLKEKRCLSWICAEGVKWVQQEYPTPRPLYGEYWSRRKIMVHEGEKAVDGAVAASKPDSGHPWQSWLSEYAHITWRGGAIAGAPYKADWKSIPKDAEVFLMPDNDGPGFTAMHTVADCLTHVQTVLMAHYHGTELTLNPELRGWDMGDPPPFYDPSVLINSAQLAEVTHTPKLVEDKVVWNLRKQFAQKIVHVNQTGEYMVLEGDRVNGPISRVNLSEYYLRLLPKAAPASVFNDIWRSDDVKRVSMFGYDPRIAKTKEGIWKNPPRLYAREGKPTVNLFESSIRPVSAVTTRAQFRKATKRIFPFLRHLIPDPVERKTFIRWMCLVALGEKPMWAVLLISDTHGTGKSTLLDFCSAIVGRRNVSEVTSTIMEEKFNSWAESKQMILCHELKESSGGWGWALAEKMKPLITEPTVSIRRMGTDVYSVENRASILASSNHFDCLRVGDEDRRWFMPKVREKKIDSRTAMAIHRLHEDPEKLSPILWLVREYGHTLRKRNWIVFHPEAPFTEQKQKLLTRTMGTVKELITEEWLDVDEPYRRLIVMKDVQELCRERNIKVSLQKLRKEMDELGLVQISPPNTNQSGDRGVVISVDGTTKKLAIFCRADHVAELNKPQKKLSKVYDWVFMQADLRSKAWARYRLDDEGGSSQDAGDKPSADSVI